MYPNNAHPYSATTTCQKKKAAHQVAEVGAVENPRIRPQQQEHYHFSLLPLALEKQEPYKQTSRVHQQCQQRQEEKEKVQM